MSEQQPRPLFTGLADHLRSAADDLTEEWLDHLGDRLGVRPRRLLPSRQLKDHIPDVVRGAADFLGSPVPQPPNEVVDILRTLAQLRREQGYDIQEILAEIDILSDLIFRRVAAWVDEMNGLDGGAAMRAAARLSSVLRSIASVAVGTYREEELRQDRQIADRLSHFAATLSHELMNPLNTAGVSAELLLLDEVANDPDERQKQATRILDRVERMRHLVDDVRALAVAEGARADERWVSIREVVQSVLREVQPAAERHGVELKVEPIEDDFEVDTVRVEIALMNLVTNAIKYSDPDKEERWVELHFGPAESEGLGGGRRIVVADNGLGIEASSHNKVFQRFFRGHPEIEGTGLGLAIAQRVVEQRGGRLWFESERGEGTTFIMEIPQRLASEDQEPEDVER